MAPTLQDQLAKQILQYFPQAEVKKINKDNYLDIHIPSAHPKRGTHLFFNTGKGTIKTGFYCREADFIEEVLDREMTLEAYSQGIRPSRNPEFGSIDGAVFCAVSMINNIANLKNIPFKKVALPEDVEEEEIAEQEEKTAIIDSLFSAFEKTQGRSELITAIDQGKSYDEIEVIINSNSESIFDTDTFEEGYTALHYAAWDNKDDIVKLLLENGAEVDALGADNRTALNLCAANGHLDSVKILVEFGADVNKSVGNTDNPFHGPSGGTPLREAIINLFWDVSDYLIANDADLEILNEDCLGEPHGVTNFLEVVRIEAAKSNRVDFSISETKINELIRLMVEDVQQESSSDFSPDEFDIDSILDSFEDDEVEKGFADLIVRDGGDDLSQADIHKYLKTWQVPSSEYSEKEGITAYIPDWINKLSQDKICPSFTTEELNQIDVIICNQKIIPVLGYAPEEFLSETKSVWWIVPFCIWRESVASWVFIDKNGFYAPYEDDNHIGFIAPWDKIENVEFQIGEDVNTLILFFEGGELSFDEFVCDEEGNSKGSYLSIVYSIYLLRSKTIEVSRGKPMWFEGAGGEGFKKFNSAKELLDSKKWGNPDRPDPRGFGYVEKD